MKQVSMDENEEPNEIFNTQLAFHKILSTGCLLDPTFFCWIAPCTLVIWVYFSS